MLAKPTAEDVYLKKVVIIGGGFAGLAAAKKLKSAKVQITIIDKSNHHLFQPLLYQVATAVLSPSEIAQPIRSILRHQKNVFVCMGEVGEINHTKSYVATNNNRFTYDYLIVASGAKTDYFGHQNWQEHTFPLKNVKDALKMRAQILRAFEQAEWAQNEEQRKQYLTFVVIGGGPTGVELCGALSEIARYSLAIDFRNFNPTDARIILIEAGPRILPTLNETLAQKAHQALKRMGVEIITGQPVTSIDYNQVMFSERVIKAATIIWSAGVKTSPIIEALPGKKDKAARAIVQQDLSLPNHSNIMVVGDSAHFDQKNNQGPLPGLASVAIQMGRHAASNVIRDLTSKPRRDFKFLDYGTLAQVGRLYAVGKIGPLLLSGFAAWFVWVFIHLRAITGFNIKLIVFFRWAWSFITFKRDSRLVVERRNGD